MHIVIAGGTSHIARAIVPYFLAAGDTVTLFARRPEAVAPLPGIRVESDFSLLPAMDCDVLINCIGAGTPDIVRSEPGLWFTVLEKFDELAMRSLREYGHDTLYIHFSSGAVYDRKDGGFAGRENCRTICPNDIRVADYYSIAKLYAEAKHRAHSSLRILDLRIFSFFSRHIKLGSGYFMTDLMQALLRDELLLTSPDEMIRDYPHPEDVATLIRRCAAISEINAAADIASAAPVKKSEILRAFQEKFGLRWEYSDRIAPSPNGNVSIYAPGSSAAHQLCGIAPRRSSIETLLAEGEALLKLHRAGK